MHVPTGRVDLSAQMFEILGLSPSDVALVASDVVERVIHPEDRASVREAFTALLEGEATGPIEFRIVRPDGSERWVDSDAELERDESGALVGLVGFVHDTTERKREQMIADARFRLVEYSLGHTLDELLEEALNEAEELTGSAIGFIELLDTDQGAVTRRGVSSRTKREIERGGFHAGESWTGHWVDMVPERRAVIRNDVPGEAHSGGWPAGHVSALRQLIVPVMRGDRIAAAVGVGNKPGPYGPDDAHVLTRLADLVLDVVDRKRAEDGLRLTDAFYRTLLESAPIAIVVERGSELLFGNEAHKKLFGYSSLEELQKLLPPGLIAPQDRERAIDWMRRRANGDGDVRDTCEIEGLRSDGTTFPMRFGMATAVLPDGPATIIFHEDLTEVRRADEALRASEQKFETAFNSAPFLMAIIDVETGRMVDVSEEGSRTSGFRREELIGRTSTEIGWMLSEEAAAMGRQLAAHGRVHGMEVTRRGKDGRAIDILMFADPVTVGGRRSVLFTGIDITERRRVERELIEMRALQEAVADSTDDYIWSVDAQSFALTSFNREFRDYMSQVHDTAVDAGMTPAELFQTEADTWSAFYRRALALGSFHTEYDVPGQRQHLSVAFHALKRGEEAFGISVFARDITEAKNAEEALRDSETQLRQSQKMEAMGRLAGGIAHDFNNVLTAIGGYAQLLEVDLPDGEHAHEDVAQIRSAVTRAGALTSKLLTFSGRQPSSPATIDLAASIHEFMPILRRVVPERIDLVANLSATPPIVADPSEIDQVVLNLVINAADAIYSTGHIEIDTSTFEREVEPGGASRSWVQLTVRDNGAGMSEEIAAHAFEPFFTTKRVGEGTGLGLATVYGVVEQLGGSVEVETAPGAGTAVVIELPATPGTPRRRQRTPEQHAAAGNERVLLVEDEDAVRDVTRQLLTRLGYSVTAFATPREALETDPHTFDVLVTDVVMREMDGFELARRLHALRPDLPVVFVSGYQPPSGERATLDHPGTLLLPKPFTQSALADAVRTVLRQGR